MAHVEGRDIDTSQQFFWCPQRLWSKMELDSVCTDDSICWTAFCTPLSTRLLALLIHNSQRKRNRPTGCESARVSISVSNNKLMKGT